MKYSTVPAISCARPLPPQKVALAWCRQNKGEIGLFPVKLLETQRPLNAAYTRSGLARVEDVDYLPELARALR
ncbi:hypothetical protein [Paraburkholderia bannensis]|uniref:hypothetical protein n=1 Tax=Paraburkholderia bannensis TaxID=765414 RepID=UPI002AC31E24|nr:hypothetical protein [Paraburkholderia bannensis]